MTLSDQIDNAIVALERLLAEASREIDRSDLPDEWADDLESADDAIQEAISQIGSASDFSEAVDLAQKMLRRIDKFDEDEDA